MLLQTRLIFSYKPQKNHSAFFWGWMADYVEKVCYYFTHWDSGTIHLYWCQYCETKKPCRSICFCSTYYFLRQKKKLHTNILSNTLYMKWIGSFYLLYFKPKTSFKHLPILMRKLLLFCDILPGIRTIKIPSGF